MFTALSLRARTSSALLLIIAAFAALAFGISQSRADSFHSGAVYTASNAVAGNQVLAFDRDHDGNLTPAGSYSTGGTGTGASLGSQGSVVLSDNGRYLVAVDGGSNDVALFAVRPHGLKLLDRESAGGTTPVSATISGDLVYVVNDGTDNIAGFRIVRDSLRPIAGSVKPLSSGPVAPGQISFDRDGRQLVVTLKDANQIVTFQLNFFGQPGAAKTATTAGLTPFGFAIDRHGDAIVSEAASAALSSYDIDSHGNVTLNNGPVSTGGQNAPCWVVLSKDNRFAYTTNAASNSISSYRVAANGHITLLNSVAATTVAGPQDMALSDDGHYLYAVSRASGAIDAYRVGFDGSLTHVATTTGLPAGSVFGLAAS